MKQFGTAVFLLAASLLGAEDLSLRVNGTTVIVPGPAGLAPGGPEKPEIRNFTWSLFKNQEIVGFFGIESEMTAASLSQKPDFHRFVTVIHPGLEYSGSLAKAEYEQLFVARAADGALSPVLESWSQANRDQLEVFENVMNGRSLSSMGEEYDIDRVLNTGRAVGSAFYKNLQGSAFYPAKRVVVMSRSYCLAGDKLLLIVVSSELESPSDIDWVIRTNKEVCTGLSLL